MNAEIIAYSLTLIGLIGYLVLYFKMGSPFSWLYHSGYQALVMNTLAFSFFLFLFFDSANCTGQECSGMIGVVLLYPIVLNVCFFYTLVEVFYLYKEKKVTLIALTLFSLAALGILYLLYKG